MIIEPTKKRKMENVDDEHSSKKMLDTANNKKIMKQEDSFKENIIVWDRLIFQFLKISTPLIFTRKF